MSEKTDSTVKSKSLRTYLIFGIMWVALGLFGLIFDPSKNLIITSQFVCGISFIVIYLWLKYK